MPSRRAAQDRPPGRQLSLPLAGEAADPATAATPEAGAALRRVMLAGQPCLFRLRRGRRRTIGFQIDDHGLTVSAPRWVSVRAIEEAILEKERWIRSKLVQWRNWRTSRPVLALRCVDGARVPYLGQELTVRLVGPAPTAAAALRGTGRVAQELHVPLAQGAVDAEVRNVVQGWFKLEAARVLGQRLQDLAQRGSVRPTAWRLSSARTQWGSCNEDGRIRLNWRLMFYPIDVIDYVIAHELAHLAELNHSDRFWQEVARLLPDFESARDRIKDEELASLPL